MPAIRLVADRHRADNAGDQAKFSLQTQTQSRGLMQFVSDASCPDGYDHCSMATERCYGLTMGRVRR